MLTEKELKTLLHAQQGELDAVLMYEALAKQADDPKDAELFRLLAAEEGRHAAVFRKLTNVALKPKRFKAVALPALYRVLGRKRLYPLIAQGEYAAYKSYAPVAERFPEVASVRQDENRHGDLVNALLK